MVEPDRFGDRYRIKERLLSSGASTTYLADDESRGSAVILKVFNVDESTAPDVRASVSKRIRAIAALSHPNIAAAIDHGEERGRLYVVFEQLEGFNLARKLDDDGPVEIELAIPIVKQICDALAHAHSAGLVHGNLTPAEIVVTAGDRVKVTGFEIGPGDNEGGSLRYLAPECAAGRRIGPKSDVYSLGIILFEMLTGNAPRDRDDLESGVVDGDASSARIPAAITVVVAKATSPNAHDRFRGAAEFRSALEASLSADGEIAEVSASPREGRPVPGRRYGEEPGITPWTPPVDRYDSERLGKRVLVVFLVVALVAFGAFFWRLQSEVGRDDPTGDGGPTASRAGGPVTVPDVVGMEDTTAMDSLAEVGLDSSVQIVPSRGSSGIVVDQDPDAGTEGVRGSRVILFVGREVGSGGDGPSGSPEPSPSP